MQTLAQRLRHAREAAGLSQSALARAVGIKPQTIQLIEAGRVRRPRHLIDIANALKVSVGWLSGTPTVTEIRETGTSYRRDASPVDAEALAVARLYTALDRKQRELVLAMLKTLARKPKSPAR